MKEDGLIRDKYEILFKEFQNLITFSYLVLVLIGLVHDWIYYLVFGINIFEFSQAFDFLIAPFKRPVSILLLFIAMSLGYLSYHSDNYLKRKKPRF